MTEATRALLRPIGSRALRPHPGAPVGQPTGDLRHVIANVLGLVDRAHTVIREQP